MSRWEDSPCSIMRKISDDLCFFGTYVGQNIAIFFVENQYSVKRAMTLKELDWKKGSLFARLEPVVSENLLYVAISFGQI